MRLAKMALYPIHEGWAVIKIFYKMLSYISKIDMEKGNGKTTQNFTENIKIPVSCKLSYNFDFLFE